MPELIEYTLVSADGVVENPAEWGAMTFADEAYLQDGLGLLLASAAMIMGRRTYEASAAVWPVRTNHPWASRLNGMQKFVVSSTLREAAWENTRILRGDVRSAIGGLKRDATGPLLIWGHTQLAEALWRLRMIDRIDLAIHPLIVGAGQLLFRPGDRYDLRLVGTKAFSKIVKLTYVASP